MTPGINAYLAPAASTSLQGSISFVVGLIGIKLAEVIIKVFDRRGSNILEHLAGTFLGPPVIDNPLQRKWAPKRGSTSERKGKV